MKKSELNFKCVLRNPCYAKELIDKLRQKQISDESIIQHRLKADGKNAIFLSVDNVNGFRFGLSSNPEYFCAWPEPLISYEDALKLIESVEPAAPEFDIKPFDKVLVNNLMNGETKDWCCDLFSHIPAAKTRSKVFACIGCNPARIVKYEGNEHLIGARELPPGWWECKSGEPVWKTK